MSHTDGEWRGTLRVYQLLRAMFGARLNFGWGGSMRLNLNLGQQS